MNQSKDELKQFYSHALKWACRSVFVVLAMLMTYIVTRESYNFVHWVPHHFLREIGIPYQVVLWSERNADLFLHFLGAMALTLLIYGARFKVFIAHSWYIFVFVSFICLATEVFQLVIARGFESSDLLLGILGSFMAYSTINKKN